MWTPHCGGPSSLLADSAELANQLVSGGEIDEMGGESVREIVSIFYIRPQECAQSVSETIHRAGKDLRGQAAQSPPAKPVH